MTNLDPMLAVQLAILSALKADPDFMATISGIYDWVPEGVPFPFVTLGDATEARWNNLSHEGRDITYTLHIWSQASGYSEALKVKSELVRVLDGQPLESSDVYIWRCQFETSHTLRDPDGITRHVPVIFRVGTQTI